MVWYAFKIRKLYFVISRNSKKLKRKKKAYVSYSASKSACTKFLPLLKIFTNKKVTALFLNLLSAIFTDIFEKVQMQCGIHKNRACNM